MPGFFQRRIHAAAFLLGVVVLGCTTAQASPPPVTPRHIIPLDGTWQIAEGRMDVPPATFERTVPVPGLVTLAVPAFTPVPGPVVGDRRSPKQKDPARDAFWYRRTFRLDQPVPAVARLKVAKAMFGSQAILNGQVLGEHAGSFTPAYYDVRAALRPGENVLLIRVGADRDAVPATVPTGFDPEKVRYPPGIFDSVELILSGTPYFLHVQTVPDIVNGKVRVQAVLRASPDNPGPVRASVAFVVREAKSGRIAGRATSDDVTFVPGRDTTVEVNIPIAGCRLWSPEDPFLYRLEADSGTDRCETRFGMREFKFDPATRHARLNGKPYFLRGSNITLYRFFEDPECKDLPWRADWVRRLHERMKDMHWNSLRYCIGFPPEAWYDIADELGILIQDEYPFWGDEEIPRDQLQQEFTEWMQERWNHPCVFIWDARNEGHGKPKSPTSESGAAIAAVRGLDLSDRPWDNGWGEVGAPTDSLEAHTYHYAGHAGSSRFTLADLAHVDRTPRAAAWRPDDGKHAIIFNEYGWIWLNRDGSPTTLSADVYRNLLGDNATAAQRLHLYARMLSAQSEFWRSHRKAAAVMHFASLAYSRADGQTSDHWADIEKLTWEPEFERYVRDAFAPVGLMLDFWNDTGISGKSARVPVRLINDLEKPWSGAITLRLRPAAGGAVLHEQKQDCRLAAYGDTTVNFDVTWPAPAGACILEAELPGADGKPVRSTRELAIVDVQSLGLAFGRPAAASSFRNPTDTPACAVDGDLTTWWFSADEKPAWLTVDLGEVRRISRVRVTWAVAYATAFNVQASRDGKTWVDLHTEGAGTGGVSEIRFAPLEARHVRISTSKPTKVGPVMRMEPGHAIRELQVF